MASFECTLNSATMTDNLPPICSFIYIGQQTPRHLWQKVEGEISRWPFVVNVSRRDLDKLPVGLAVKYRVGVIVGRMRYLLQSYLRCLHKGGEPRILWSRLVRLQIFRISRVKGDNLLQLRYCRRLGIAATTPRINSNAGRMNHVLLSSRHQIKLWSWPFGVRE